MKLRWYHILKCWKERLCEAQWLTMWNGNERCHWSDVSIRSWDAAHAVVITIIKMVIIWLRRRGMSGCIIVSRVSSQLSDLCLGVTSRFRNLRHFNTRYWMDGRRRVMSGKPCHRRNLLSLVVFRPQFLGNALCSHTQLTALNIYHSGTTSQSFITVWNHQRSRQSHSQQ